MMEQETQEAGQGALEAFKQQVFASAFGAFDARNALKVYYDMFEKPEEESDYDVAEFEPESEADIAKMLNEARRAGVIS